MSIKKYFQPEAETMPVEEIKKLQSEKIVKQVKHVYDNVEYYRNLMDKKGVKPEDIKGIDDLHKLPFLSKADLRDAYPYGLLAKPLSECVRIHSTSGTTGRRVVAFYTQHDVDLWEDCCARAIVATGGSVIFREEAINHLKKKGKIIYLNVSLDEIKSRLDNISTRGVAATKNQTIDDIYNERSPLYLRYADIVLDLKDSNVEQTVEKICNLIK